VVKIACPSDCPFLKSGQAYHWLKKYVAMFETIEEPSKRQRLYETSQRFHELLAEMEELIVSYSVDLTSITDRDVHEAIVLLRSTYQTEQKGVIYEHTSSNPLAQALSKELRHFLENFRKQAAERGASLRTSEVIACLDFLEIDVAHHLATNSAGSDYLRFISRSHPEVALKQDRTGIILPP